MQPSFYPMPREDKNASLHAVFQRANARLGQGKSLFDLTMATVLCLLCSIALCVVCEMLYVMLAVYTELAMPVIASIIAAVAVLAVVLLVLPLFVGRLRLAGLWAMGEEPMRREMLYFFTAPERYGRAMMLSLSYLFSYLLPVGVPAGYFVGTVLFYENVLLFHLTELAAIAILVFLCLIGVALFMLCLFLSVFHFGAVALLVGSSRLGFWQALARSVRIGRSNKGLIYRFLVRTLLRLLLSLCTLGVLWALFYAHQTTLAYFELVMEMGKESEQENSLVGGQYEDVC